MQVFLRETEKLQIDECLHQAIMKRVITIQRWVKTKCERKNYLQLRESALILQVKLSSLLQFYFMQVEVWILFVKATS